MTLHGTILSTMPVIIQREISHLRVRVRVKVKINIKVRIRV